jgi:hypothetical protein
MEGSQTTRLEDFRLGAGTPILTSRPPVQFVNSSVWTKRDGAY